MNGICTSPEKGHEFFSIWDFQHNENVTYFEELPYDGLLGIGPFEGKLEKNHSFSNYLYENKTISNNSLTYRQLFNGNKELIFGLFGHTSAKVRFKSEQVHEYLKTLRIDVSEIKLGNHSFPTHLGNNSNSSTYEDPKWMRANMIIGGEPYLTIETPYIEELKTFEQYLNETYPEVRIFKTRMQNGQIILLGMLNKRSCSEVKLKNPMANFTFNTSKEH